MPRGKSAISKTPKQQRGRPASHPLGHHGVDFWVDHMVPMSSDPLDWLHSSCTRTGLWGRLLRSVNLKPILPNTKWMALIFNEDRHSFQQVFRSRVGAVIGRLPSPVAASTPIVPVERFCICDGPADETMVECTHCLQWYHAYCLRVDAAKVAKDDLWQCCKCLNNSRINFPSYWLQRVPAVVVNESDISNIPHALHTAPKIFVESHRSEKNVVDAEEANRTADPDADFRFQVAQDVRLDNSDEAGKISDGSLNDDDLQSLHFDEDEDADFKKCYGHNPLRVSQDVGPSQSVEACEVPEGSVRHKDLRPLYFSEDEDDDLMGRKNQNTSGNFRNHEIGIAYLNNDESKDEVGGNAPKKSNVDSSSGMEDCVSSVTDGENGFSDVGSLQDHRPTADVIDKSNPNPNILEPPERNFTFEVDCTKWTEYLKVVDGKTTLVPGWTDCVFKFFSTKNKFCVPTVRKTKIYSDHGTKYLWCDAKCKHPNCYNFKIECLNFTPNQPLKFHVRSEGEFYHDENQFYARQLRADVRLKHQEMMIHRSASAVATAVHGLADMEAIRGGNTTSAISRGVLKKAKNEYMKKQDNHSDPVLDLMMEYQSEESLGTPYIRELSLIPLRVVYFCEEQANLLALLHELGYAVIFHIDATGKVYKEIQKICPTTGKLSKTFMYAICVAHPFPGHPPIALCEFLTNDHTSRSLARCLDSYVYLMKQDRRFKSKPLCSRVETDFSLALIYASFKAFGVDPHIKPYLNHCFEEIMGKRKPAVVNFHVCKAHVMKNCMLHLRKCYGTTSEAVDDLKYLLQRYLQAKTLEDCAFYVHKMFVLCLIEFITPPVESEMETLRDLPEENSPIDTFKVMNEAAKAKPRAALWSSTCFGLFFNNMYKGVEKAISDNDDVSAHDSDEEEFEDSEEAYTHTIFDTIDETPTSVAPSTTPSGPRKNAFYSPSFANYLRKDILPFTPLLTHIMFDVRGDVHDEDHQWPVEYWNKIVKVDEHGKSGRQKMGRYIRASKKMIKGRCVSFEKELRVEHGKLQAKQVQNKPSGQKRERPPQSSKTPKRITPTKPPTKRSHVQFKDATPLQAKKAKRQLDYAEEADDSDTDKEVEGWDKGGQQVAKPLGFGTSLRKVPFVLWGTDAVDNSKYVFTNSCPVDNVLMTLTYALHNFTDVDQFFRRKDCKDPIMQQEIRNIVNLVMSRQFNQAKAKWLLCVTKNEDFIAEEKRNLYPVHFDVRGCEKKIVADSLAPLFECFWEVTDCPQHGKCRTDASACSRYASSDLYDLISNFNERKYPKKNPCPFVKCSAVNVPRKVEFTDQKPVPLLYFTPEDCQFQESMLNVKILNVSYKLIAVSLWVNCNHFVTAYPHNKRWLVYDGTEKKRRVRVVKNIPKHTSISIAWYTFQ